MKDPETLPGAMLPSPGGQSPYAGRRSLYEPPPLNPAYLDDLRDAIATAHTADGTCEDLLLVQAHLLDAMFRRVVFRDMHSESSRFEDGTPRLSSEKIDLALRLQRQCRQTAEALAVIRHRQKTKSKK